MNIVLIVHHMNTVYLLRIKLRWLNCIYSGQGKRRRSSEDGEADQRAAKKAKTDNSEVLPLR